MIKEDKPQKKQPKTCFYTPLTDEYVDRIKILVNNTKNTSINLNQFLYTL